MVTPASWALIRLHKHYCNNLLPRAGGLYDQPNGYVAAMEMLNAHRRLHH